MSEFVTYVRLSTIREIRADLLGKGFKLPPFKILEAMLAKKEISIVVYLF